MYRKYLTESSETTIIYNIDSEVEELIRGMDVSFKGTFGDNELGKAYIVRFTGEESAEAVEIVEEHFYEINFPGVEYMNIRGASIEFILEEE